MFHGRDDLGLGRGGHGGVAGRVGREDARRSTLVLLDDGVELEGERRQQKDMQHYRNCLPGRHCAGYQGGLN